MYEIAWAPHMHIFFLTVYFSLCKYILKKYKYYPFCSIISAGLLSGSFNKIFIAHNSNL